MSHYVTVQAAVTSCDRCGWSTLVHSVAFTHVYVCDIALPSSRPDHRHTVTLWSTVVFRPSLTWQTRCPPPATCIRRTMRAMRIENGVLLPEEQKVLSKIEMENARWCLRIMLKQGGSVLESELLAYKQAKGVFARWSNHCHSPHLSETKYLLLNDNTRHPVNASPPARSNALPGSAQRSHW